MAQDEPHTISAKEVARLRALDERQPFNLFTIAQEIESAKGAVQAVAAAQKIVDTILAAVLPADLPDELGKEGWMSRWEKMGSKRWPKLRAALLERLGLD